jgi:acyl-coenzyme A synthetase/AMP-(fatty) acid ligase
MVKRRGYRIEPAEIERALLEHPVIDQAVVISYSDAKQGVKIQAFLVSKTNEENPDFLALKLFCQQNLPLYMLPDGFRFVAEIPQTSSQKIDFQLLKASLHA